MQLSDLKWKTRFTSVILLHDSIVPNTYSVGLTFNSNTDNIVNQNRAFDRIKYFFQSMTSNGLIMNYKNDHANNLSQYSDKIIMIPEEPFDQIMVAIIHSKLVNIVEGNIQITEVQLNSWQGDNVTYTSEVFGLTKLFLEGDFDGVQWWQHSKPITFTPSDLKYKILEWKDINLEFDKIKKPPHNKKVKKVFNPTIIDGGKK
jgi:hypothetical protein|tara:strand:- start:1332 stop:1937 length:606 start_codon:yes stop_codon:yes gene_type:complete